MSADAAAGRGAATAGATETADPSRAAARTASSLRTDRVITILLDLMWAFGPEMLMLRARH
jgi:hypothetical protein